MSISKFSGLLALILAAGLFFVGAPKASAQIAIQIGPEPVCPYGYYDVAPFNCAPYGYYGPQWFIGGRFIGAGRWFHGPAGFRGYVNNRYHPGYGYRGGFPNRGERPIAGRGYAPRNFRGNEMRDGRGRSFRR